MLQPSFSNEVFLSALGEQCVHCSPKTYAVLDSTNTEARRLANEGAAEGTVVFAEEQRKGRGRQGRVFFSPSATGLYMSLILRPRHNASALYITTAAAVAVAQAIEELLGVSAQIKWVNDVYCDGKKVCGILTEGVFQPQSGQLHYAVLGIGVNLSSPQQGFPKELQQRAGSLLGNKKPPAFLKEKLAAAIITSFWQWYEHLEQKEFLEGYRRRCLLTGRTVQVLTLDGQVTDTAVVRGISDNFALQITLSNGEETELCSGEVSIGL